MITLTVCAALVYVLIGAAVYGAALRFAPPDRDEISSAMGALPVFVLLWPVVAAAWLGYRLIGRLARDSHKDLE